ncbi:hypothetical protein ACOMHN_032117 [Nucella lapillus]
MCRRLPSGEMYEGKNIHFSLADKKPLCSFSKKQCNQRRLNGYGFCVRHILEDPTAPFRRCAYVAKSSQHLCTQAIPQGEERAYCNNHMQVLGMLPRRERKPKKEKDKDKDNSSKDNVTAAEAGKLTFGLKSKKLTLPKPAAPPPLMGKILNPADDPDDPYAFHDAAPEVSPAANSLAQSGAVGMLPGGLADLASRSPYHPQSLPSPSQVRPCADGMGAGGMPKAKLYPELAEKLEKSRPAQEAKTSKSRARSSRTMNKLQTKIAQNKIKDKLRKSQESNQTELSPSQVASPERVGLGPSAFLNSGLGVEFGPVVAGEVNPANLNSTQLHPLALPGGVYPPLDALRGQAVGPGLLPGSRPDLYEVEHLKQSTLTSHHHSFHPLPPPYPGLAMNREQHFSPPRGGVNSRVAAGQRPPVETPVTTSLPSHTPPPPCLSFSQAASSSLPVVSPAQSQPHHLQLQHQMQPSHQSHLLQRRQSRTPTGTAHAVIPPDKMDLSFSPQLSSVLSQTVASRKPNLNSANSVFPQTSASLTLKPQPPHALHSPRSVDSRSSLDLPPPPPYVPRTRTCSVPTSVAASSSVLSTHIHRPKGIWTEKEAGCRLRSEEAVKLYGMYARHKIYNHVLMNSTMNLCASDEESSEDEMIEEPLPFQRDWKAISDDEDNELEDGKDGQSPPQSVPRDGELAPDLRMVKLGVMRARYRRYCTQTKHANRANTRNIGLTKKFTLALIRLAKTTPTVAAHTLSAIYKKSLQWPQERKEKRKEIWRKVCQYKDGADKRCTVLCLPYTNHCRKHIMYNVDQQVFQFCTAKNSDNTQCCMPVVDIHHDFPLCYPHALQAEKQKKAEAAEVKKRPRKKTKPPALTRPPRKGKKKKGKNIRYQKPIPPDIPQDIPPDIPQDIPQGSASLPEAIPMEVPTPEPPPDAPTPAAAAVSPSQPAATTASPAAPVPVAAPVVAPVAAPVAPAVSRVVKEGPAAQAGSALTAGRVNMIQDAKHQLEHSLDLEETDLDKQFSEELPLEQASRLLEDEAFDNFPDDAFNDIFTMAEKNGESDLARENGKLFALYFSSCIFLSNCFSSCIFLSNHFSCVFISNHFSCIFLSNHFSSCIFLSNHSSQNPSSSAMAEKNGESDLARENEKLELQLAEVTDHVNKAKDTLDKLLNGSINMADMGEQDTTQLAEMIATHYTGRSLITTHYTGRSLIATHYTGRSLIATHYTGRSLIATHYTGRSLIATHYTGRSLIATHYTGRSLIATHYTGRSLIATHYTGRSLIATHYTGRSLIATHYTGRS